LTSIRDWIYHLIAERALIPSLLEAKGRISEQQFQILYSPCIF